MGGPNFTQCAIDFLTNDTNIGLYSYNGPTRGIAANFSTQITYHGCVALCGSGSEYYNWYSVSNTMLTWVLPILGIILQAPFEPHAIWSTVRIFLSLSSDLASDSTTGLRLGEMDRLAHGLPCLLALEHQCHQYLSQDCRPCHSRKYTYP